MSRPSFYLPPSRISALLGRVRQGSNGGYLTLVLIAALSVGLYPLQTIFITGGTFSLIGFVHWPSFRLLWFLIGAILVFQTGSGLSAEKMIYLSGVLVGVVLAARKMPRLLRLPWGRRFKPAVAGSVLLAIWILLPGAIYFFYSCKPLHRIISATR